MLQYQIRPAQSLATQTRKSPKSAPIPKQVRPAVFPVFRQTLPPAQKPWPNKAPQADAQQGRGREQPWVKTRSLHHTLQKTNRFRAGHIPFYPGESFRDTLNPISGQGQGAKPLVATLSPDYAIRVHSSGRHSPSSGEMGANCTAGRKCGP